MCLEEASINFRQSYARKSWHSTLEKIQEHFLQEYFTGVAHKSGTTYDTVNSSICERLLPGYKVPNAYDVIAASPFPDSDN